VRGRDEWGGSGLGRHKLFAVRDAASTKHAAVASLAQEALDAEVPETHGSKDLVLGGGNWKEKEAKTAKNRLEAQIRRGNES
jgi:hypothetical protein